MTTNRIIILAFAILQFTSKITKIAPVCNENYDVSPGDCGQQESHQFDLLSFLFLRGV